MSSSRFIYLVFISLMFSDPDLWSMSQNHPPFFLRLMQKLLPFLLTCVTSGGREGEIRVRVRRKEPKWQRAGKDTERS